VHVLWKFGYYGLHVGIVGMQSDNAEYIGL